MEVLKKVEHALPREREGDTVQSVFTVTGFSFGGSGQNTGLAFVTLKDWDERARAGTGRAGGRRPRHGGVLGRSATRMVFAFAPPAVHRARQRHRLRLPAAGPRRARPRGADAGAQPAARHGRAGHSAWSRVRPNGLDDAPQFQLDIDHAKAGALGLVGHRHQQHALHRLGRHLRQRLHRPRPGQAGLSAGRCAAPHAAGGPRPAGTCATAQGEMVPFSAFATAHWTYGSPRLERYNGMPSVQISGSGRARAVDRRRDGGDRGARSPSCRPASATSGPACPTRNAQPARRRRRSTRCRCWWCSSAWRRSTKAGRSRSR